MLWDEESEILIQTKAILQCIEIYLHGQTCRDAVVCFVENLMTLKDFMDNFCTMCV